MEFCQSGKVGTLTVGRHWWPNECCLEQGGVIVHGSLENCHKSKFKNAVMMYSYLTINLFGKSQVFTFILYLSSMTAWFYQESKENGHNRKGEEAETRLFMKRAFLYQSNASNKFEEKKILQLTLFATF